MAYTWLWMSRESLGIEITQHMPSIIYSDYLIKLRNVYYGATPM